MKYFSSLELARIKKKIILKKGMQYFSLQELARIKKIIILEKGGKYFSLKQLVRVKKRLMHKKIYKKIIITLALCDVSFFGVGSLSLLFVEFYFCLFFCYIFVALHFNIDIIIPQIIHVH